VSKGEGGRKPKLGSIDKKEATNQLSKKAKKQGGRNIVRKRGKMEISKCKKQREVHEKEHISSRKQDTKASKKEAKY
jgi:hypothetical protein